MQSFGEHGAARVRISLLYAHCHQYANKSVKMQKITTKTGKKSQ